MRFSTCRFILTFVFILSTFASLAQFTWTQVPTPDPSATRNLLRGISGTSANDVWAVGDYQPVPWAQDNQILHWNGSSWIEYPTANLSLSQFSSLWDVAAIALNNAWAVGSYAGVGSNAQPILLRWNGIEWTYENIPNQPFAAFLYSIDAVSATDIWAAGGQAGIGPDSCYVIHYDGSTWNKIDVPPVGTHDNEFDAIDATGPNDAWGVGSWRDVGGSHRFLAMHWNGSSWTNTPMPPSMTSAVGYLYDVSIVSANEVWAVGDNLAGGIVVIRWNGTEWVDMTSPYGAGAIATPSSNNVYGVGANIFHFNGAAWAVQDSLSNHLYPSLVATTVLPDGEIWAAGRDIDSNGVFYNLVYRSNGSAVGTSTVESHQGIMTLYPNPFVESLRLRLTSNENKSALVTMTDCFGRVVLSERKSMQPGVNNLALNVPHNLASGVYVINVLTKQQTYQHKVIRR
ncbi:MAG TPA: T9SS type A sorting domain-containing protein [Chitinophagales bacterium]|nr:T9SS type A sorting domain-containing protein [Chitinophagales bacterium]